MASGLYLFHAFFQGFPLVRDVVRADLGDLMEAYDASFDDFSCSKRTSRPMSSTFHRRCRARNPSIVVFARAIGCLSASFPCYAR